MSSLRNAIPRRPHKERSQEHGRQKRGILEKHKDYSLRAKDHNAKKARLKILRQKAADRNPDEFHFAMLSSKTKNGIKIADRGNKALSMDVVKLLKTQDAGYVRTALQRTRVEKQRLEEELVLSQREGEEGVRLRTLGDIEEDDDDDDEMVEAGNRHTVFVDDEVEQHEFDPAEWFETDEKGVHNAYNRPRRKSGEELLPVPTIQKGPRELEQERMAWRIKRAQLKKQQREQESKVIKLDNLRQREKDLAKAEQELEIQRARMNNTAGGTNKNGVKFKVRERKR